MVVNAIQVENLFRSYEDVKAVKGISFYVEKGSLYSLLGPNGAGKSTTINILSCNLSPDHGKISILGYDLSKQKHSIRKYIGICPQDNVLFDFLTVKENLLFFGNMYEIPAHVLHKQAKNLIKKLGLYDKRNTIVKKLSGGQKRRVNLMIGLVHDPDIIFLDEPTAGLDPQTRRLVWEYILDLKKRQKTIILTTHYMDEADILSDKVGIMDHGKIISEGTPDELKESVGKGDNLLFTLSEMSEKVNEILTEFQINGHISSWKPMKSEENQIKITAMDGIGKIGIYVNKFLEIGIKIQDIAIQANSLESVFLELTGRTLRE